MQWNVFSEMRYNAKNAVITQKKGVATQLEGMSTAFFAFIRLLEGEITPIKAN